MRERAEDRFHAAFVAHHRAVLAYALRRVPSEADAEDAVADTFTVAWRRIDRLPDGDAALPWLLAIARRVIANQRRSITRRVRLGLRLRSEPQASAPGAPAGGPAIEALERLRPDDRELLRLLTWEGLSQAEAAVVLGTTANAVAIRLHRARRRFADELSQITAKGSGASRTSREIEARPSGRRNPEEAAS